MPTGREAGDVDLFWIDFQRLRVLVDPCDARADLLGHGYQVPAGLYDVDEVESDEICSGRDKVLRHGPRAGRGTSSPRSAMDVDHGGCVAFPAKRPIQIQPFDCTRPIGISFRSA